MSQAYTERFTEVHQLGGGWVQPLTGTAGQVWFTNWESMQHHQRAVFMVFVGAMAAGATLNFVVGQAKDAAGTWQKEVTGKAITELTQAGNDATSACIIEVRTEELDVNNGFTHVCAAASIEGGHVTFCVVPLFDYSNHPPVSTATWTEIID